MEIDARSLDQLPTRDIRVIRAMARARRRKPEYRTLGEILRTDSVRLDPSGILMIDDDGVHAVAAPVDIGCQ